MTRRVITAGVPQLRGMSSGKVGLGPASSFAPQANWRRADGADEFQIPGRARRPSDHLQEASGSEGTQRGPSLDEGSKDVRPKGKRGRKVSSVLESRRGRLSGRQRARRLHALRRSTQGWCAGPTAAEAGTGAAGLPSPSARYLNRLKSRAIS